jgi:N-acetylmuramic acid 6-phosphate etherase
MREEPPTPGTESADARHPRLDRYDTPDLVAAFVDDQALAAAAVQAAVPDIARAVDAALPRLRAGGRLIYVGAGTSGRLGVLDAVELGPTFGWPAERARALMAGGDPAMYVAVEGAEDDASQAAEDLHRLGPGEHDVVIGVAASGRTPYVLGALQHARACGALTIGIASNPGSPLAAAAEVGITLDTGPEVISGSARG